jgi:hypothetical protein
LILIIFPLFSTLQLGGKYALLPYHDDRLRPYIEQLEGYAYTLKTNISDLGMISLVDPDNGTILETIEMVCTFLKNKLIF